MTLRKPVELNIIHAAAGIASDSTSGYSVELIDITVPAQPHVVFINGGNSVPASPFKYDFALDESHLKFGNQYRVKVRLQASSELAFASQEDFGLLQDSATESVTLKLSRV